jgi:hypothetical protein
LTQSYDENLPASRQSAAAAETTVFGREVVRVPESRELPVMRMGAESAGCCVVFGTRFRALIWGGGAVVSIKVAGRYGEAEEPSRAAVPEVAWSE